MPAGTVELEAQSLVMASGEAAPAPVVKAEEPAAKPAPKAEARKEAPKKPEVKKAQPRKEAQKDEKKKAEARKQESHPRLSAVDAALADARAGRLAPVEDILVEDAPAREYDRVVTSAKFSMKGSLIKLTLRGNSPMIGHFYVLEEPDRVVLDLAGNWQIEVPKVPSNRLIGAVRVGQHEDKTRLVFDMKNPGKAALVPLNRNALELRIQ
jgi:vacuolar-type H+-ATPase subunit E/Vma4